MPRKQTIIIFPHLNDCGGNLEKQWYVEYQYRIPGEMKARKERIYKGLSKGTAEHRRALAEKIIVEKKAWLKSGAYLHGNERRVYEDELQYRNEAQMFGKMKENTVMVRESISAFIRYKKPVLNESSLMDYQSKLRRFCDWLVFKNWHHLKVTEFRREHFIDFFMFLTEKQELSRITMKKYIQLLRAFFDYELVNETIIANPVVKIPNFGKVVDYSATPFTKNEITRLKELISKRDPQLWLACQIQYYCAIRPGVELRLMKIGWIDFDNMQIRIPSEEAKNNKTEIVEIPSYLYSEFERLNLRSYSFDLYLFGKGGVPGTDALGKNNLRNRFNRFRDELGISQDKKFYSWKHTGAIDLIQNGAHPFDLKDHLRHKNFETTEKYLKKRVIDKRRKISQFTIGI